MQSIFKDSTFWVKRMIKLSKWSHFSGGKMFLGLIQQPGRNLSRIKYQWTRWTNPFFRMPAGSSRLCCSPCRDFWTLQNVFSFASCANVHHRHHQRFHHHHAGQKERRKTEKRRDGREKERWGRPEKRMRARAFCVSARLSSAEGWWERKSEGALSSLLLLGRQREGGRERAGRNTK